MTDKHFKHWINNHVSSGVVAFKILSYETLGDTGKEYNPLDEDLMDSSNVSCNFDYIETLVNLDSKTCMGSIRKEKYKQNECWINSIIFFLWRHSDEHQQEKKCIDQREITSDS